MALQALEAQSQPLTFAFSAKAAVGNTERSERGWLWPADRIFNFNVRYNMPKAFEAKTSALVELSGPKRFRSIFSTVM